MTNVSGSVAYASTSLGRFLASDPVMGLVGGQSIRFNPYIYAVSNPTRLSHGVVWDISQKLCLLYDTLCSKENEDLSYNHPF